MPVAAPLLAFVALAFDGRPVPAANAIPPPADAAVAAAPAADRATVTSSDIEAVALRAVGDWLSGSADRVDLRPVGRLAAIAAPKGRIGLRARPLPAQPSLSPRASVWVDMTVDDAAFRSFPVVIEVHAWQSAWVALRDLSPGTRISKNDVQREEIDVAASGKDAWRDDPEGRVLKRGALAGRYLTLTQLGAAPAVTSGDRVRLMLRTAGIEVVADAEALQDGQVGDRVRVRIEAARGAVSARVREAGLVELSE